MTMKIACLIFLGLLLGRLDAAALESLKVTLRLPGVIGKSVGLKYYSENVEIRLVIPSDGKHSTEIIAPAQSDALDLVEGVSRTRVSVYENLKAGRYLVEVVDTPGGLAFITHYYSKIIAMKGGKSAAIAIELPVAEVAIPCLLEGKFRVEGGAHFRLTSNAKNGDGSPMLEFTRPCRLDPSAADTNHLMRCYLLPDGQYDFLLIFDGGAFNYTESKDYPFRRTIHVKDGKLREEIVKFHMP